MGVIANATVIRFDEIDSTNSEAMRRATRGERGPLWILAAAQSAGRGRSGRHWSTPSGNLAATLLFAPQCETAKIQEISLVAGVAIADTIERASRETTHGKSIRPDLKWPNDALVGGRKIAGILIEATRNGDVDIVAIGMGVNLKVQQDLAIGRPFISLSDLEIAPSKDDLFKILAERLDHWLTVWRQGRRFEAIREAWLSYALPRGTAVSVHAGDRLVQGRFAGLDADGSLLLAHEDASIQKFAFGDVNLLSEAREGDTE